MKGVFFMVKGISRRVVVVRPESGGPFEQAIFLVRDPAFPRGDAVREACRIAEGCLSSRRRRPRRVSARLLPAAFALGALLHRRFSHIKTGIAFISACIFRQLLQKVCGILNGQ